ncbi:cyclic di-GMP phosphodiesterase Gmr [mine drainage metagenome]|uniref:Cyclic di-GMP phosphodiesterase Gmr n=1 Tax=mine drainage metagenome TaxID=410659 RepID=A0A1J5RHD3_9ZZZZ
MDDPMTVLVLTPSLGGHYFGELLAGLTQEVAGVGGRLVVVETLPEAAPRDEAGAPGDFATPVAWSHVDGVVSITTAVGAPYLRRLREAGRPVVLSSTLMADFDAPAAMPDNHGGTFTAVEHLIGHGHTRIGFVGNLAQQDIRDRMAAYERALETYDLELDPTAIFTAPDNAETGGCEAALAFLACERRPTALMVATDRNALGLMRVLTEAGLVLPDDLAIVGFDNIEAGAFSVPALTTVNQRFSDVGSLAGRLVMAAVRGEAVPSSIFTPQAVVLTVRTSCGCAAGGHRPEARTGDGSPAVSPDLLRDELQDVLITTLLSGDETADGPARAAVLATIAQTERLLTSWEPVTEAEVRALTISLRRLTAHPETLRRVIDAVTEYVERIVAPGVHASASARVTAALWKVQAGAFLSQVEATKTAIAEQYVVDAGLLDTTRSDPRTLDWLAGTHIKAAVLALWADEPSSGLLDIVGSYDPGHALPNQVGTRTTVQSFPPTALIDLLVAAEREICVVVPVRTAAHDWGLLAIIGAVDSTSTRETYQHWAGLLCTALASQRLQAEVSRSALYDALTGLPNRRLFLERLTAAIARHDRSGTPFAVLFLDLDGFKLINDSLGHQMGDRVLTAVGDRIGRELRTVDTGARFGGDEFAILLHDTDPSGALLVARRVQAALARTLDLDGPEISIRASMGIATSSIDYTSGEDILRDADTAMYRAKADEPGAVAFFDEAMRAHAVDQQHLHTEIHRALEEHQFEVFYQPIVNLTSGRTDRFEALVRWRHPQRGLVMPDEFLPVMEETGLVIPLGHWILDEVCRQLAQWGPRVVNVAINVSDREFWHRDLLPHVLEALARHRLTPDRLTLEITESVLMRRPEVALRMMHQLHDAGLRLHIDDFGTGYSSLETLHRFPVDAFKIDRSFLRSLASGDHTTELITALVGLGKSLGLAVVAEGVETAGQLTFLQAIGCATGQGYLFMPAVTHEQARDLLDRDLADRPDETEPDPTGT